MRCVSVKRSLYFKIFSTSFFVTFLSHYYYYYLLLLSKLRDVSLERVCYVILSMTKVAITLE
jgi:hypothetical protein